MKKSFANFWRRNLGFARLAVITNLEYRANFLTDAALQPALSAGIEVALWFSVFRSSGKTEIGGFGVNFYLAYALWAAFLARTTSTWMYEFRMIEEVESGSVNALLARPTSFFEYYMSQFLGYKFITTACSLAFPLAAIFFLRLPTDFLRVPLALLLAAYYLVLVQTLSFCIACFAFRLNKVSSITMAKNLGLWLFSGELFPLDLVPENLRSFMILQPFANAVYVPVAFITGRVGPEVVLHGFLSTTVGILVTAAIARFLWRSGLRTYAGTGA